ncbi:MAG: DUF2608 domain-containing protein, partial [Puniceicoccales bacterium]|nr:DUF2608 domain-containing protein [Puniceicoccales bacterium]
LDQAVAQLNQLIDDGGVNANTLVVFDDYNTLLREGSDQTLGGAIEMHPGFAVAIRRMQNLGATVIVQTNEGTKNGYSIYANEYWKNGQGNWEGVSHPSGCSIFHDDEESEKNRTVPADLRKNLKKWDYISFQSLRQEGLKHIGISPTKFSFSEKPLKSFQILGKIIDPATGYLICIPILEEWGGLFGNFYDETQQPKHKKGDILKLFLDKKNTDGKFKNIVFVDDCRLCAENVEETMQQIDMPCTVINFFLPQVLLQKDAFDPRKAFFQISPSNLFPRAIMALFNI